MTAVKGRSRVRDQCDPAIGQRQLPVHVTVLRWPSRLGERFDERIGADHKSEQQVDQQEGRGVVAAVHVVSNRFGDAVV